MRPEAIIVCGMLSAPWLHAQAPVPRAALAPASTTREQDIAAIRAVVASYVAARDLRDPTAVGALFTPDADQYTTSGEWRRGQTAIVAGTARSSAQNPGERRIRVESVRIITADVAIVDGPYEIVAEGADAAATRRMWTSLVLVRQEDGWRITAIRNMRVTAAPPQ